MPAEAVIRASCLWADRYQSVSASLGFQARRRRSAPVSAEGAGGSIPALRLSAPPRIPAPGRLGRQCQANLPTLFPRRNGGALRCSGLPGFDDLSGLGEIGKPMFVEAFVSEFTIETLHVGILDGFPGFDETLLHPGALRVTRTGLGWSAQGRCHERVLLDNRGWRPVHRDSERGACRR